MHPTSTKPGQRRVYRLLTVILCASLLLGSIAAAPYTPASAPAQQGADDGSRVNYSQIVVKFKAQADGEVSASADLAAANPTLQGLDVKRLFSSSPEKLETNRVSALAEGAAYVPNLNLYYIVQLPAETTFEDAQATLAALQADPAIELAYMEPIYLPASPLLATDDFTGDQGYLQDAASNGIDAVYAWTQVGGKGDGVQVIDIENGWQFGHEDLPITSSSLIESINSPDRNFVEHGTAVLGVIAARANVPSIGVTGIAPKASLRMVSTVTFLTPDAINKAAENSAAGDIIVIPTQALGPVPSETTCPASCDCTSFSSVPIEYWQANFDAILAATQAGIIVVEAAGTGAMNLDASLYGSRFDRSYRDSGAILVGAGTSAEQAPVCDANYGKRIDVQGWGENVVTTGYGDKFSGEGGDNPNQYYTDSFGGSSAAAAMVTGAAASLQGIALDRGYVLTPDTARSILRSTGTAQTIDTDRPIGPLPNLRKAIDTKLSEGVTLLSPVDGETVPTRYPTLNWQDYFTATSYELVVSYNSSFTSILLDTVLTGSEYTFTSALANDDYYWRVRPMVEDEWLAYSQGFTFTVSAITVPAVTVLGPASGAGTGNFVYPFTWKTVTVADGYEIQIDTTADFQNSTPVEVLDTTYIPDPALDPNMRYVWRVRAFVGDLPNRSYGPWSARRTLYTGLDISEAEPAVIAGDGTEQSLRPLMDWGDVTSARSYWVQTSLSATFTTLLRSDVVSLPAGETIVPSQYRPPAALPTLKTVYWRVRAQGRYTWSAWLEGAPYETGKPPAAPALLSPADKAVGGAFETGITLQWSKPTGSPDSYEIQVATDKAFTDVVVEDVAGNPDPLDPIKNPNYLLTGLDPESVYYWRVRSVSLDGYTSWWSGYRTLYTTPPVPTGLNVPLLDSLRPTVSWDKVDLARSYVVQFARDSATVVDKTTLFTTARILGSFTTPLSPPVVSTVSLPRNISVVWRVRSGGAYGYSAWSEVASFTTPNPPNVPVLVSPADGANLVGFTPNLDWNASVRITGNTDSDASGYQVQVLNNNTLASATFVHTEDTTATAWRIPMDLLPTAGRYYWRVRAVSALGQYSTWSSLRSFVTGAILTGTVTDALSGDPLPNVTIQVAGRAIQTVTDSSGVYSIRGLPEGTYQITAAASGYMRQTVDFYTSPGVNRIRDIALVEIPDTGTLRIALTWDASPNNLDAHLWLPSASPEEIYKDNIGDVTDPTIGAQFYREDNDGWGPEIIDIASTVTGVYQFGMYMNSFTPDDIIYTNAVVTVYDGAKLLGTMRIPTEGSGRWWKVFRFDSTTRKITVQNVIQTNSPKPAGY